MTPVSWRNAGPDDAEALSYLGRATFLAAFAHDHPGGALLDFLRTEHSQEFYAKRLADPDYHLIIGETPLGVPVGYVMLTPPDHPDLRQPGDIELKRIYMLGPWQGGGNGKALVDMAMDVARERNAARVILAVYENNERARAFYEREKFAYIGDTIFMVGDVPFKDLLYAKVL